MKYVLMFAGQEASDSLPAERQESLYQEVYAWFDKYADQMVPGGAELRSVKTATTVRHGGDGEPLVVDGPFSEAKEVIGGFCIIDVDDLDAALALARTWPMLVLPGESVEVRPVVDHSGDM